jgi:hypothetical protein
VGHSPEQGILREQCIFAGAEHLAAATGIRHLDRSSRQLHRLLHGGETPVFAFRFHWTGRPTKPYTIRKVAAVAGKFKVSV